MSLIPLGFWAASGGQAAGAGDYELLETTILTSSASSVTFSSLGDYSDYKHLQLRMTVRTDRANNEDWMIAQFNGNTGSNYAYHGLAGNGSTVYSQSGSSATSTRFAGGIVGGNATANSFAGIVVDVLDFSDASKNTTIRSLNGFSSSTSQVRLDSGLFNNTGAITSIVIDQGGGANFVTGCRFSLYGVK